MRPSFALRLSHIQLTLFTRANCGLCDVAKSRILEFNKKQSTSISYSEIDIMAPGQQKWRDIYDFDVPVLHVDRVAVADKTFEPGLDAARKLMHRFTVQDLETAVDEARRGAA